MAWVVNSGNAPIDGVVEYYSQLPAANTQANTVWLVEKPEGIIFVSRKKAGLYYSDGVTWEYVPNNVQADFVMYDNASTNLVSTNAQTAITEIQNNNNGIQFNTSNTLAANEGQISWNKGLIWVG